MWDNSKSIRPLVNYFRESSDRINDNKKNYYKLKDKNLINDLLKKWLTSKVCILITSYKLKLSPLTLLKAYFLQMGLSQKDFAFALDSRSYGFFINSQIELAIINDFNFSRWGQKIQQKIGNYKERVLQNILLKKGYNLLTETDMKSLYDKTPDIYCKEGIVTKNGPIYWVESKAFFGDSKNYELNNKNQLTPYKNRFGTGVVIYWFGLSKQLKRENDIYICDYSEFVQLLM